MRATLLSCASEVCSVLGHTQRRCLAGDQCGEEGGREVREEEEKK